MNNYIYYLGEITFKILLRFIIQKRFDTPIYTFVLTEPVPKKTRIIVLDPNKTKSIEASGGSRNAIFFSLHLEVL